MQKAPRHNPPAFPLSLRLSYPPTNRRKKKAFRRHYIQFVLTTIVIQSIGTEVYLFFIIIIIKFHLSCCFFLFRSLSCFVLNSKSQINESIADRKGFSHASSVQLMSINSQTRLSAVIEFGFVFDFQPATRSENVNSLTLLTSSCAVALANR